jgi:hypothetical protein
MLQCAEQLRTAVPPAVAAAAAGISSQRSKLPGTKAAGTTGAAQQCDFVCPVTVFVSERVLGHDVALGHLSRHFFTLIERDIAFPTDVIVSERVSICISPLADIFSTATGMKQFMQCLVDESFRSTSRCWRSCADLHPSAQGGGCDKLDPTTRQQIDSDLTEIDELLGTGMYDEVVFSACSNEPALLGASIFHVGEDVHRYIVAAPASKLPQSAPGRDMPGRG